MRINLTPKKGGRRLAGAAVAVSALAVILGLIPAASAHTVARTGPAAVAAPGSSTCHWLPTPAQVWVTDPAVSVGLLGGKFTTDVAARRCLQNSLASSRIRRHCRSRLTTIWSTFPRPNYVINDTQIVPDPGSVNPFVPGTRVEGTPRNYTVYLWPDSIPVPAGLKNVVLYPTKPADPGTRPPGGASAMRHVPHAARVLGASGSETEDHRGVGREPEPASAMPPYPVAGTFASQIVGVRCTLRVLGPHPELRRSPPPATRSISRGYRPPSSSGLTATPALSRKAASNYDGGHCASESDLGGDDAQGAGVLQQ